MMVFSLYHPIRILIPRAETAKVKTYALKQILHNSQRILSGSQSSLATDVKGSGLQFWTKFRDQRTGYTQTCSPFYRFVILLSRCSISLWGFFAHPAHSTLRSEWRVYMGVSSGFAWKFIFICAHNFSGCFAERWITSRKLAGSTWRIVGEKRRSIVNLKFWGAPLEVISKFSY